MKKIFLLVVLAALAAFSAVSAQTCDCESLQAQVDELTARVEALEAGLVSGSPSTYDIYDLVTLGDFGVSYVSHDFIMDYSDRLAIEIRFMFYNNSENPASYNWSVNLDAYQDGIELGSSIVIDSQDLTEVEPGKYLMVKQAYVLRNTTDSIRLEFTPMNDLNADPVIRVLGL